MNTLKNCAGFIKPDTEHTIFFYEQDYYVLSNFSAFKLRWKGILFDTSEAAYHWEKFHAAPDVQGKILNAMSAHDAFRVSRDFKEKTRPDWDNVKLEIMRQILLAKVDQHPYVKKKLLETGSKRLVEDSWRDGYWGWGADAGGKNMLGKLWMAIRSELQGKGKAVVATSHEFDVFLKQEVIAS